MSTAEKSSGFVRTGVVGYYFICDPEPVSELVPFALSSSLLRLAVEAPKSLFHVVDGERAFRVAISGGLFPYKRFWVTYTPNVPHLAALIAREPIVPVLLIHTMDATVLAVLPTITCDYLVLSDLPEVQQQLESDPRLKAHYCHSHDELARQLAMLAPAFLGMPKRKVCTGLHEQKTNARRLIQNDRIVFPSFRACRNNYATFKNLVDPLDVVEVEQPVIAHDTRPQALVRSMELVYRLQRVLLDFERDGIAFWRQLPGLVLVAPSHDPWLKQNYLHRIQKLGTNNRKMLRDFVLLTFTEQNLRTYDVEMTRRVKPAAMQMAMGSMLAKIQFLDDVAGLHTSFEDAPYFRAPLRGSSLSKQLAPFNPRNYSRRRQHESVFASIVAAGEAIAEGLPPELKSKVPVPTHRVVALSDLPMEWTMIDGEPLAFLTDVCRLPESPITSLLAQYSRNQVQKVVVRPDILDSAMVVCGAPVGDRIHARFEHVRALAVTHRLPVRFVHCLTCADFMREVETHRPSLLIVDTHGDFQANEVGSLLQFGEEWLNGNQVVAMPRVPPLIFLSCCWGAPVYGCANTIAQAFFEAGALSVTTTFLPVGIDEGTLLYYRLLNNLKTAARKNLHRDWASFISHLLRTSYFRTCAERIAKAAGPACIGQRAYHKAYSKWAARSMYPPDRKGLFSGVFAELVRLVKEPLRAQARRVLERRDFLPEFLFYTTLGRADLVLFDAYRQESFVSLKGGKRARRSDQARRPKERR